MGYWGECIFSPLFFSKKERWKNPDLYNDNVSYEVVEITPSQPNKGAYKVLGHIKRPNIRTNCSACEIITTEGRKEYEITYVKIDGQLKIINMTNHVDKICGDDY